jgi:hypothetical protein
MATTIRILNWNIQNLGPVKAGIKHQNYDVISAIARLVVYWDIDILCLLELNTTIDGTAETVCNYLMYYLQTWSKESKKGNQFNTCILSPGTGVEYYGFFVRDTNSALPLQITAPLGSGTKTPVTTLGGASGPFITSAEFTGVSATGVTHAAAPLMLPDMALPSQHHMQVWNWSRRGCLGLFYIPGAEQPNRLLPIFACHFKPGFAEAQMKMLPSFSLLASLRQSGGPMLLTIKDKPKSKPFQLPVNYWVLTGDFNVDLKTSFLDYISITSPFHLSAEDQGRFETLFVTYNNFNPRKIHDTDELAVKAYDAFFLATAPNLTAAVTGSDGGWGDIAGRVKQKKIELKDSVWYYQDLDKRGFSKEAYPLVVNDYVNQLTGDKNNNVTIVSALLGARLISDHLPVMFDLTI